MNAPSRYELYVLGDGEKKVIITEDESTPNAVTLTIRKEDHTIANMLRQQLLITPNVVFAGYKVPHPLEPQVQIKLQTDGITSPIIAVQNAIQQLLITLDKIKKFYQDEVIKFRAVQLENAEFAPPVVPTQIHNEGFSQDPLTQTNVDDAEEEDEYAF